MKTTFLLALFFAFPAVAFLLNRWKIFRWLGPVVLCYLFGIALGNIPGLQIEEELSHQVAGVVILLAIPLLLFSTDFLGWISHAREAVISFCLAIFSVILVSLLVAPWFSSYSSDFWKIGGMMVGVYSGGTPNLMSIGMALGVEEETYVIVNTADITLGGIYLLFLMTLAKPLLSKYLPPFSQAVNILPEEKQSAKNESILQGTSAFILSSLLFLIGVGLSQLFFAKIHEAFTILTITTLAVALSFSPRVRSWKIAYSVGDYLILVFCVLMGGLTQAQAIFSKGPQVLFYCSIILSLSIILHYTLAFFWRIDVDTVLITSTAAIYGPAFVGIIATRSLKNPHVMLSGLTTGLVGIAIGNYLGLSVAYLIRFIQESLLQ